MLDLEQSAVAPYIEKIKTLDEYALGMILDKIFEIDSLSGWRNTCKGYLRKIRGVLPTTPDQNRIGCENGGGSSKKEPAHRPVQWFSSSGG
ncbi:hypothetical protein [Desulfofundulus thermobenzoicus]|uniref:hypothetical protein n=1 Tax=Desulfofundulus thermobenzoicus TaxID=29376 RepID=UPI0018834144|nr:hypothetical protein [Desulfofundulus thermobenzoicus]